MALVPFVLVHRSISFECLQMSSERESIGFGLERRLQFNPDCPISPPEGLHSPCKRVRTQRVVVFDPELSDCGTAQLCTDPVDAIHARFTNGAVVRLTGLCRSANLPPATAGGDGGRTAGILGDHYWQR
jgi:hypothetical protein